MSAQSKTRIFNLDLVRGVFILLMIVGHSIFFFHTGTNTILSAVDQFADQVSFIGLLFISGAVGYIAYIHYRHPNESVIRRVLRRLIWYLLGYYALALIGNGVENLSFQSVIDILLFQKLVPFTDFIIPFLLFSLLNIPLRAAYRLVSSSIIYTSVAAVALYMIGSMLSGFSVPDYLVPVKAIFVGHAGWYSFPILQYFSVYLFGVFIGRQIYEHDSPVFIKKILSLP